MLMSGMMVAGRGSVTHNLNDGNNEEKNEQDPLLTDTIV